MGLLSRFAISGGPLLARAGSANVGSSVRAGGSTNSGTGLRRRSGALASVVAQLVCLTANGAEAMLNGRLGSTIAIHFGNLGIVELGHRLDEENIFQG